MCNGVCLHEFNDCLGGRLQIVYKIPYRRARAWSSVRASKGILHTSLQRTSGKYKWGGLDCENSDVRKKI